MPNIASRTTKLKEKRGQGEQESYKPWIKAREIPGIGTCSNVIDWKHGRTMELLSQGEMYLYYLLRWKDEVIDIREQYPLDIDTTNSIADQIDARRVQDGRDNMTTDMLVTLKGGDLAAYSVKDNPTTIRNKPRELEKLTIEKLYWLQKKIPWYLVYKNDMNPIYVDNIRLCVEYYDLNKVHDDISMLKHLIAIKKINLDMTNEILPFGQLISVEPYKTMIKKERNQK